MKKKTVDAIVIGFGVVAAACVLVILFSLAVVFGTAAIEHIKLVLQ